ncbi:uncharacterized protein LOC134484566 isoform X2 [Rattus norvegicus]|uniref:uncharacterized protein LOC134484566 isoform X2 n=1 Tax=Rattus norvegicus TaxID=10116 RepID=UPI002FD7EC19
MWFLGKYPGKMTLVMLFSRCTELLEKLLNILKTFGQMMTDILLMLNCDKRSKKHFVVSVSSTYNLNLKEENYWANPNSETFLEVVHMLVHMCNTCMPTVQEVEEGVRFRDAEITATCELSTGSLEEQNQNFATDIHTECEPLFSAFLLGFISFSACAGTVTQEEPFLIQYMLPGTYSTTFFIVTFPALYSTHKEQSHSDTMVFFYLWSSFASSAPAISSSGISRWTGVSLIRMQEITISSVKKFYTPKKHVWNIYTYLRYIFR